MRYRRVLLKLSGEALLGPNGKFPYDPDTLLMIANEISEAHSKEKEIAVVVGGGNIFRGANGASSGMNRTAADQFGMLATIQNGVALLDLLKRVCKLPTRLMTALRIDEVAEPYIAQKAVHHLENGRVIILAGGTGHAFCTTDYAAAVRACEIDAQLVAKATNIDGVYDRNPHEVGAKLLPHASYNRCIRDNLQVMDTEAFALLGKQHIPIRVFSLKERGNIEAALTGAEIGSLVSTIGD